MGLYIDILSSATSYLAIQYIHSIENSSATVESLQYSQGCKNSICGDQIYLTAALAQADVGIAIGSGTDIAAETADIILANSNPKDIAKLILFGKATYNKMIQNLVWATAYNAVAIPHQCSAFKEEDREKMIAATTQ